MSAEQTPAIETLAARLFLADPDRVEPGPWMSMAEVHQRPYRVMAQAATDVFAPVLAAAVREAEQHQGLQRRLHDAERAAGWDPENKNSLAEEIAHLHEEVSEAFRAFRARHDCAMWVDETGKPQGVPAELADVAIGLFYIAERFGFDLFDAIETKHAYNLTRSYAAEGRRLHADRVAVDAPEGGEGR